MMFECKCLNTICFCKAIPVYGCRGKACCCVVVVDVVDYFYSSNNTEMQLGSSVKETKTPQSDRPLKSI